MSSYRGESTNHPSGLRRLRDERQSEDVYMEQKRPLEKAPPRRESSTLNKLEEGRRGRSERGNNSRYLETSNGFRPEKRYASRDTRNYNRQNSHLDKEASQRKRRYEETYQESRRREVSKNQINLSPKDSDTRHARLAAPPSSRQIEIHSQLTTSDQIIPKKPAKQTQISPQHRRDRPFRLNLQSTIINTHQNKAITKTT